MRPMNELERMVALLHRKDYATVDAQALDAQSNWAYDALMKASKELEEVRKEPGVKDYKVHAFECNLCDAARAYTKISNKMRSAYNKVARVDKEIEQLRRQGIGVAV